MANYSKNGRFGDTKLMLTSEGDVEHINSFEMYVKDNIDGGEEWVKRHGSRTINPHDGLTENSWLSNWIETGEWDTGDDLDSWSNFWDATIGKDGLGSFFREQKYGKYGELVERGKEGIKAAAEAKFGPGGYFDVMRDQTNIKTANQIGKISENVENVQNKSGLAFSGDIIENQNMAKEEVIADANLSTMKLQGEAQDTKLAFRNQINQLLADYVTLAEEEYSGADELYKEFDEWTQGA